MSVMIYWFRQDARLHDAPALRWAAERASALCPVVCLPPESTTRWGVPRLGPHRQAARGQTWLGLDASLRALGSRLAVLHGEPAQALPALARQLGADTVVCERIAAPEEDAEVAALRAAGLTVREHWQSGLFEPSALPFAVADLPKVFSQFRQQLSRAGCQPLAPLPALSQLPPWPAAAPALPGPSEAPCPPLASGCAFPYALPAWRLDEAAGLAHLAGYCAGEDIARYKATRNGLSGTAYSSKFSPWLACGALSVRQVWAALAARDAEYGVSEGTEWLRFELLWREYFRLLHLACGRQLYGVSGLNPQAPAPRHHPASYARWCEGRTGQPLVDAAMRELAASGYLSNRLRQVAASYLLHELDDDWRAGAAWFEAQLVDYDVYSNQGNWLYIAGRGTDSRGGRRFNPDKQVAEYDADGAYRRLWGTA